MARTNPANAGPSTLLAAGPARTSAILLPCGQRSARTARLWPPASVAGLHTMKNLSTFGRLAVGLLLILTGWAQAQLAVAPAGAGTEADPYRIAELGHLVWMADNVAGSAGTNYTMTADIDASVTADWNDAGTETDVLEGFNPIGNAAASFIGTFDGAGHTITGLVINRPSRDDVGLFGCLGTGGRVRGVGLLGGAVAGYSRVGGLAGNASGSVENCFTSGAIMAHRYLAGGLIGLNNSGTVADCHATGPVTAMDGRAGGLIGQNNSGTLSNCFATGRVKVFGSTAGGLVGLSNQGAIANCYSTGLVSAVEGVVGGLIGYDPAGTVSDSFWDTQTSGQTVSAGGTGKTTEELKQQATWVGWNFTNTWAISEGISYPYLMHSPQPFKFVVNIAGPGTVLVDPPSADGTYAPGTVVTLTAVPNGADAAFIRWMDVPVDDIPTATIVMDIHRSVTAEFRRKIAINTLADLAKIGNDPGYPLDNILYVLTADIDASQTAAWNDEGTDTVVLEGFMPIGSSSSNPSGTAFTGIFEGNGHTIAGLVINRPSLSYVGLFRRVGRGGLIRNLGLAEGAVTGSIFVGSLAGICSGGTVMDCRAATSVKGGSYVGGLVGANDSFAALSTCHATGPIEGSSRVGGLIGANDNATASGCYATGTIQGHGADTGGLVGANSGTLATCYAAGAVAGLFSVGGLVGKNDAGTLSDCYASGTVKGTSYAGGLIGTNSGGVSRCFAVGAVPGDSYSIGGLIGFGSSLGGCSDSYWNVQTSGQYTSAGGTGMTTAELKQQATFANWDFIAVWDIAENAYPWLRSVPPQFELVVSTTGPGTVIIDPVSADGTYAPGTTVTLTAVPDQPDDSFLGWVGVMPELQSTVTVIMDVSRAIVAKFGHRIEIDSLADLARIGADPAYPLDSSAFYLLTADIDASETATWNDPGTGADLLEGFKPIGACSESETTSFRGVFNGGGHTISGLVVNRPSDQCVGLFGRIGQGGQVRNLGVVAGELRGTFSVGGLVAYNAGTVSNCYGNVTVRGLESAVGGLVGYNHSGTVSNCYASGAVITGFTKCSGGLVGSNRGIISNCYSTGTVSGNSDLPGGLVGCFKESPVFSSYWDVETSGRPYSAGGIGKTTAEMKRQATFVGWDFTDTWGIIEDTSYPYLRSVSTDSDDDGVIDQIDRCPGNVAGAVVDILGCPLAIFGDFDRDGDVDSADLHHFALCTSGPGICRSRDCIDADSDSDLDVDQSDFGIFQRCFSGENVPADPQCASRGSPD